jgi:hypothetical protein
LPNEYTNIAVEVMVMEADNQIGNSCTFQRLKKIPMLKAKTNNRGMILLQMKNRMLRSLFFKFI